MTLKIFTYAIHNCRIHNITDLIKNIPEEYMTVEIFTYIINNYFDDSYSYDYDSSDSDDSENEYIERKEGKRKVINKLISIIPEKCMTVQLCMDIITNILTNI